MSVSLSIILDTRRIKKKISKYPIKLRVTNNRESQYYQTVFNLTTEDYDKLSASRISAELQVLRDQFKDIKRTAENAVKEMEPFSFDEFEMRFILNNPLFRQRKARAATTTTTDNKFDFSEYETKFPILKEVPPPNTILAVYLPYIKYLLRRGRIGTAFNYYCSYKSFKKFRGNSTFMEITEDYLYEYEHWMLNAGKSKSTIGIYTRPLRIMFNEAISAGIIRKEKHYPFGKRKYIIPTSKNMKKALRLDGIKEIYYYQPKYESERKARDFWLFFYMSNGMNPKDVAYLQFKNIQGEYFVFERAKTERATRTDPKPITVYITEDMWGIINRWGNKDRSPNNYIFPILEHGLTALRQYEVIQLFIRFVNDWMLKISDNLKLEKKPTTITSRHSFSTIMKRSGVSTEFIQEALGHTDLKTTENYLDSFENEVKKEFAGKLLAFKDN